MTANDTEASLLDELLVLATDFRRSLTDLSRQGAFSISGLPIALPPPDPAAPPSTLETDLTLGNKAALDPAKAIEQLAGVRVELGDCQRCKLATTRDKIVFGVGSAHAPLMFIGEAPGADEDRTGEPFVGRAGQLLDKMIIAMGWTRESVYIANVLKCRPPKNRDPQADEVSACEPFLARQIEAIQPRLIVTLGKPAAHLILRTRAPISALRGQWKEYLGIPVMPTFHPAYLLRSPDKKRAAWNDLKMVMAQLKRFGIESPSST